MTSAAEAAAAPRDSVLMAIGSSSLFEQLAEEILRISGQSPAVASSLLRVRMLASRCRPEVILIDDDLLGDMPLAEALRPVIPIAPVVLIASPERQEEAAKLVCEGGVEFVAKVGNYISLAASLIAKRMRWARVFQPSVGPPWPASSGNLGAIFRHEINNPLTGILGNAELVLARSDRLAAVDAQRLRTVIDLAVRLRETIRRLSDAWERHPNSLTPA